MLRALLALLVVANLLFFAVHPRLARRRGRRERARRSRARAPFPPGAAADDSPLAHRQRRERAADVDAAAPCYETPTFTAGDAAAVEAALAAALPAGAWIDNRGERTVGARAEVTHIYRVIGADATLTARLATLRLDAAGRGFSFSPCARPERPPR